MRRLSPGRPSPLLVYRQVITPPVNAFEALEEADGLLRAQPHIRAYRLYLVPFDARRTVLFLAAKFCIWSLYL